MRTLVRRRTALTIAAATFLLTAAIPAIAVAKEGFQARLDAPIGRDTPGGTTLLVGMTVTFPDGSVTHPVQGAPIYLELVGRDGASIRAMGREDQTMGHYQFRIEVPPAGIASVEIGISGTAEVAILLQGTALVAGGISARTAQVAPALPAAPTPFARASAVAPAVAPPVLAPAVPPVSDPAAALPAVLPALALLAIGAIAGLVAGVALTLAANRRSRSLAGRPPEPAREA
jgi:hypothetical protein